MWQKRQIRSNLKCHIRQNVQNWVFKTRKVSNWSCYCHIQHHRCHLFLLKWKCFKKTETQFERLSPPVVTLGIFGIRILLMPFECIAAAARAQSDHILQLNLVCSWTLVLQDTKTTQSHVNTNHTESTGKLADGFWKKTGELDISLSELNLLICLNCQCKTLFPLHQFSLLVYSKSQKK